MNSDNQTDCGRRTQPRRRSSILFLCAATVCLLQAPVDELTRRCSADDGGVVTMGHNKAPYELIIYSLWWLTTRIRGYTIQRPTTCDTMRRVKIIYEASDEKFRLAEVKCESRMVPTSLS